VQFLIVTVRRTDRFPDAEFKARREGETEQARALYGEGFIRQLWHRGDVAGACILVEADSEGQVQEKLNTLPFFRAGMLEVSIIPLKPYAGFGPRNALRDAASLVDLQDPPFR
jgi:muconolactone delta-isomerase